MDSVIGVLGIIITIIIAAWQKMFSNRKPHLPTTHVDQIIYVDRIEININKQTTE